MPCVTYSLLLIIFCLNSPSWAEILEEDATSRREVTIPCSAGESPQDGVYMYKQSKNVGRQKMFYFYKQGSFTPYNISEGKVKVDGQFPSLIITFFNLTIHDTGVYWCEFNREEKITNSVLTNLIVIEIKTQQKQQDEQKCDPTESFKPYVMIIVCTVIVMVCVIGCFLILKKRCFFNSRKYKKTYQPSDSVYEEMKRNNLNNQP